MPKSKRDKKGGRKGRGASGGLRWLGAGRDGGWRAFGGAEWDTPSFSGIFAAGVAGALGAGEHRGGPEPGWGKGAGTVLPRPAGPADGFWAPDCARSLLVHLPHPPHPGPPPSAVGAVASLAASPFLQHRLALASGSVPAAPVARILMTHLHPADFLTCQSLERLLREHPDGGGLSHPGSEAHALNRYLGAWHSVGIGGCGSYSKEGLEPSLSLAWYSWDVAPPPHPHYTKNRVTNVR